MIKEEMYVQSNFTVLDRPKTKLALFDLDDTLIKYQPPYYKSYTTRLLFSNTAEKFQNLHQQNYFIAILSNQLNCITAQNEKEFSRKIERLFKLLDVPCLFLGATEQNYYRKPAPGMLDYIKSKYVFEPDLNKSFFCGDAAGRADDHSDCDIKLAYNMGVRFYTPEEYFLGDVSARKTYKINFLGYRSEVRESFEMEDIVADCVFLYGKGRNSGKTFFCNKYLRGYKIVRDGLPKERKTVVIGCRDEKFLGGLSALYNANKEELSKEDVEKFNLNRKYKDCRENKKRNLNEEENPRKESFILKYLEEEKRKIENAEIEREMMLKYAENCEEIKEILIKNKVITNKTEKCKEEGNFNKECLKDENNNDIKNNDINKNDIKNNDIKKNDIGKNDIHENDIKNNDIHENDIKNNYIKNNDIKNNDIKNNDIKNNDIKNNDIKNNTNSGIIGSKENTSMHNSNITARTPLKKSGFTYVCIFLDYDLDSLRYLKIFSEITDKISQGGKKVEKVQSFRKYFKNVIDIPFVFDDSNYTPYQLKVSKLEL